MSKQKAVPMPEVSHWAWVKRVTVSGMIFPLSQADARAIREWTMVRANSIRARRTALQHEVDRLRDELGIAIELDWQSFDTQEEYEEHEENKELARQFMGFLKTRMENEDNPGVNYTIEQLKGWRAYVEWMGNQSDFLLEMSRQVRSAERKQG